MAGGGGGFERILMNNGEKLVAIMGGGDWTDASVFHLVIPVGVNLEEEKAKRGKWYREEYCPALRANQRPIYSTFSEWLIKNCGAKKATAEIEEFWDV